MTDGDSKTFHVGPAEVPYWKFWLAGIVWKLTRGNPLPYVYLVPGAKRAAMWAFEVRVLSRDFEEVTDSTTDQ